MNGGDGRGHEAAASRASISLSLSAPGPITVPTHQLRGGLWIGMARGCGWPVIAARAVATACRSALM
jgi:hypothetical protein